MGCSTSSQTTAVDTTLPKPEESNGASTTGAANENGKVAEDTETLPDQTPTEGGGTKPDGEPAVIATSADSSQATPPAGEDSQPSADSPPAEPPAEAPAEAPAASSPEAPAPEQEAAATDSETKGEEAPGEQLFIFTSRSSK
ncbi:brain acid soluble protein 1 isoform X1 [Oryzias melastigma]|uniref:brain acid soluble protein 1 isoform X1 n=1 Tax=Oryzias melastigma TaxID=30732 RepID=UPI000CF822F3|nr:brain acid soluble protein 1 isoform X1 [Oryzias melastigma]